MLRFLLWSLHFYITFPIFVNVHLWCRLIRWASRRYSCSRLEWWGHRTFMNMYRSRDHSSHLQTHWSPQDTCLSRSRSCLPQPRGCPPRQCWCCTTACPRPPRPTPRRRTCRRSRSSRWRGTHRGRAPPAQTRHYTCHTCPDTRPTPRCRECGPRSCLWMWSTTACRQNPRTEMISFGFIDNNLWS